jgi:NAD(P)-dependent dehydrogenase (short-subunit alcohol dehydrogenase family)
MTGTVNPEFTLRASIYPAINPDLFAGSLKGKVALVTGSGRGIGREIALALASSGAAVAISGRTKNEVEDTTRDVAKLGRNCIGVVADICVREDLNRLVNEVINAILPKILKSDSNGLGLCAFLYV